MYVSRQAGRQADARPPCCTHTYTHEYVPDCMCEAHTPRLCLAPRCVRDNGWREEGGRTHARTRQRGGGGRGPVDKTRQDKGRRVGMGRKQACTVPYASHLISKQTPYPRQEEIPVRTPHTRTPLSSFTLREKLARGEQPHATTSTKKEKIFDRHGRHPPAPAHTAHHHHHPSFLCLCL